MEVCVSDEYDLAYGFSVPFAGFFSCQAGNLLAAVGTGNSQVKTKRCPKNYVRYLATVDEGCEINYCAKIQADFQAKPPNLPPFRSKPGVQKNITQSLVIQGPYGQMWVRDSTGNWVKVAGPILNGDQLLKYLSNAGNESGGGIIPVPNSGQDPSAVSAGAAKYVREPLKFKSPPKQPCCVPVEYDHIHLIEVHPDKSFSYKKYLDMSVTKCGCR